MKATDRHQEYTKKHCWQYDIRMKNYQEDLKTLQEDLNDQKLELQQKWENAVDDIKKIKISPTKQNIRISHFGIVWKN